MSRGWICPNGGGSGYVQGDGDWYVQGGGGDGYIQSGPGGGYVQGWIDRGYVGMSRGSVGNPYHATRPMMHFMYLPHPLSLLQ